MRTIAEGVHVWSPQPSTGWGLANCGLIVCPAGRAAAWIDTPYDRSMANEFLTQCQPLLPDGVEISRAIITHGNGDHLWGASVVPGAELISTAETRNHIAHEPDPQQLHALVHNDSDTILAWYLRKAFGAFNWVDTHVRTPDTVLRGELELHIGQTPVHLIEMPPAHTEGDLIAYLPRQSVVFAGDVIFGSTSEIPGDTPVHWAGPLENIISACRRILDTGAEIIVPGHGPVLDRSGVHAHIQHLDYLRQRAHDLHQAGVPALDAARQIIREDRYHLGLPERLVVTIGSEYRHLDHVTEPPNMVSVVAQMAQVAWELEHPGIPASRPSVQAPTTGRTAVAGERGRAL